MKKRLFCFFFSLLFLHRLESQPLGDGFLGLSFDFNWYGGYSEFEEKKSNNLAGISFGFIGVAPFYDIIFKLTIIDDILHIGDNYRGDADFLRTDRIQTFAFSDIELDYSVWGLPEYGLLFFIGIKFGHIGYIGNRFARNPYIIYVSPVLSAWWFIGNYMATSIKFDLPLGLFRRNLNKIWHVKTSLEFTLEPSGNILNPIPNSALFTIGFEHQFITLTSDMLSIDANLMYWKPYFKFTLLY